MDRNLKLYVWAEFAPNWKDGLAFAIAGSEDLARSLIINVAGLNPDDWGPVQVFDLDLPIAFGVYGGG